MRFLVVSDFFRSCFIVLLCTSALCCHTTVHDYTKWEVYKGDAASTSYSSLDQVNRGNVRSLQPVWIYHTKDAREGNRSAIECNPIVVGNTMFVTSPALKLIALDAASGKGLWTFDPFKGMDPTGVNRAVTYWEDGEDKRIFFSAGQYLYALNAVNGNLIHLFGKGGRIDLRSGLGRNPDSLAVWSTSPGIIYKNLIIQGTALGEGYDAAPGIIRAYHVQTGAVAWTFHTIPQPTEYGYETWPDGAYQKVGGTNSWAGMSLDEENGTVYIPTGSAAFDFYGGNRKGVNLFANCLLALDASTGKRKWHYQLVHHDLWDYDLPAPPTLVRVVRNGAQVDGVVQVTKMGLVFMFDRKTGQPLFNIEEKPVPSSGLDGEEASATQPFPVKPLPLVRQHFSDSDITDISVQSHDFVKAKLKGAVMGGIYQPPDTAGVVEIPGTRGGGEWGGSAFDPQSGILYVNTNEMPMLIKMKKISLSGSDSVSYATGEKLFTINNCSICHGADRAGSKAYPSLLHLSEKYSEQQVKEIVTKGRSQMPSYPNLSENEKESLIAFLFNKNKIKKTSEQVDTSQNFRYVHDGWTPLLDQDGHPGIKPPWGSLNAVDLNTGEILWKVALGQYPDMMDTSGKKSGTMNLGGPIVTAGGLIFIGSTADEMFRAFDKKTGELLWEYKLPAGGYATPCTFLQNGKQYIAIAAGGGGKVGTRSGDVIMAFALP